MSFARLVVAGFCLTVGTAVSAASAALADSPSTFLREQAGSAVNWQLWDAGLVKRAHDEGRPVYVFAGSILNELSRATIRQTFNNADVAAYLNANFLCVLVDRDEQPDVAAAILQFLRTIKQQDGWPAHLWLTPEMQPFEGAGYLPPSEEWGKPGFLKVARQALDAWAGDPKTCRARAADAVAMMNSPGEPPTAGSGPAPKLATQLADGATAWRGTYDEANAGFGQAPKGTEPELLRFLLRQSPADRDAALATLRAIVNGAVRDPLDGGFFSRATDAAWRVPYFQKILADQARMALACLDAAQVSGDATLAQAARGALDYALTRLALPAGGFAAAEDGTTDETASYYTWTAAEIDTLLGPDAAAFKKAYAVLPEGNVSADDDPSAHFKGKNILRRATLPGDAAAETALASALGRLRTARDGRLAPRRYDRATAGAHGLMLAALSRAGAQLGEPRYLKAAAQLFALVQKDFVVGPAGDVRRMRAPSAPAAPADYAALALGCREFARTGKQAEAGALATLLLARAGGVFFDSVHGAYFATPATLPPGLVVRPPAAGDVPAAETLALLAGAPPDQAAALAKTLAASLDAGTPAPGDVLLALSQ
jgi:uncharacterized protein YyaL (SSP411 family)